MNIALASWEKFWLSCGAHEAPPGLLADLLMAWSEPRRHYHTLQHLSECLQHLEHCWSLAERPEEICLAVWFHDAVYNPHKTDNECLSAAWAETSMRAAGLTPEAIERVVQMILTSAHQSPAAGGDGALLQDIDLAILGADVLRFAEYETQVRQEYNWVANEDWRLARSKRLMRFLDRPRIYLSDHFYSRFERNARQNLKDALIRLREPH